MTEFDIPRDERLITDDDFFAAMDLSRRGLAPIRRRLDAGDLPGARAAVVEHFRTPRRPRWFFDLRDGRRGRAWHCWFGPAAAADAARGAEDVLQNRFDMGGERGWIIDCGPKLKWSTPATRSTGVPGNVFKRCPFMVELAIAHARSRKGRYAAKLAELVDRWVSDWPMLVDPEVGAGGNVLCQQYGYKAMPTGFRLLAWLDVIYSGALFAREVPVDTAFALIRSLWFTAWQYRRFATDRYRPANHHIWQRGTIPFMLGTLLPEFTELARLREQGRAVLAEHARRSFRSDGSYEERTSGYTVVALKMFCLAGEIARLNRTPLLNPAGRRTIRRSFDVLAEASLPQGFPADIGDELTTPRNMATCLAEGHRVFGSRACAAALKDLKLLRFLPKERRSAAGASTQRMSPAACRRGAGFLVARDRWSPRASAMVLTVPDGGIVNHSHADALNLQVVVRGRPIVGTPMSRLYWLSGVVSPATEKFCRYFRGYASHNVVLAGGVPEESQPPHYQGEPVSVDLAWKRRRDGIDARASRLLRNGGKLSREVEFRHRRGWTVRDTVLDSPGKPHRLLWHFEHGVELTRDGDFFLACSGNDGLRISFESPGRLRTRMRREKTMGTSLGWSGPDRPWILEVGFGGTPADEIITRFEILPRSACR